jgi:hypothetical protein
VRKIGNADERLKQVARWHKASEIRKKKKSGCVSRMSCSIAESASPKVPQILIDTQVQALCGVLENFWP